MGNSLKTSASAEKQGLERITLTIQGCALNNDQTNTTGPNGVEWMIVFFIY